MAQGRPDPPDPYFIEVVARAWRVLQVFAEPPHAFTLTQVSQRSGLSKNQAFRLLQTLAHAGAVRQETSTRAYRLGIGCYRLIGALFDGDELLLAAREPLDWASEQTGDTVALLALEGPMRTLCVDVRESRHPVRVASWASSSDGNLHAGAAGKLLLALNDDAAVERYLAEHRPLRALTPHTLTDLDAVRAEVRTIRGQGYAHSDQEVAEGMCGVAAPVFGRADAPVAIIILSAPLLRAQSAGRERLRAVVVEAARRASNNLRGEGSQRWTTSNVPMDISSMRGA